MRQKAEGAPTLDGMGRLKVYVLAAIEAFGVDRCIFASNFPVDELFSSYDAIFDAFKAITIEFSSTERRRLFHHNAEAPV